MPSFKPKANKKIKVCKRYSTTLDGKHKEIMTDFSKDEFDELYLSIFMKENVNINNILK